MVQAGSEQRQRQDAASATRAVIKASPYAVPHGGSQTRGTNRPGCQSRKRTKTKVKEFYILSETGAQSRRPAQHY